MTDNRNGSVTLTQARPDGAMETHTSPGHFPTGHVRVAFLDDNYNPDKHFNAEGVPPDDTHLTWHWDRIQITSS